MPLTLLRHFIIEVDAPPPSGYVRNVPGPTDLWQLEGEYAANLDTSSETPVSSEYCLRDVPTV